MRLLSISALIIAVVVTSRAATEDKQRRSEHAGGREVSALHAAVKTNLDYCRQWLDEKDFKTLRQSAEGITLLADALAAQGDDEEWKKQVAALRSAARDLAAAAEKKSAEQAERRLTALDDSAARLADIAPRGEPAELPSPSAPLAAMMALLDGTHADAKRSLTFGEAAAAKQSGLALAELARLLIQYNDDAEWRSFVGDLKGAAADLGAMESDDPAAIRAALRGLSEKCAACHEQRR